MANEKAKEAVGTVLTISGVTLCLKSIGSIGVDGGDPIDATCLSNTAWMTKQPQTLKEVPDFTFACQYFPDDLTDIIAAVNDNQLLRLTFADSSFLEFWGYLKSYEPKEAGKGEEWQATGTVVVTNMDDSGVETGPTYTSP